MEVFTTGQWLDSTPTEVATAVAAVSLVASGFLPLILTESSFLTYFQNKTHWVLSELEEDGLLDI